MSKTFDEIRKELQNRAMNVSKCVPIEYEAYEMWSSLKNTQDMTSMLILDRWSGAQKELMCPKCGEGALHHIGVELFNREEDTLGEHISIYIPESEGWKWPNCKTPNNKIDTNMELNPSDRRGGITILFICEQCDGTHRLNFAQHKGHILTNWTYKE